MNNQLTLAGYVGKDPEERLFEKSETKLARFPLAVKQFAKGKEDTMWIDVEAWNGSCDKIMTAVTRGREIVVYGSLAISKYTTKDGTDVTKPIVKLTGFYLCGGRPKASKAEDSQPAESETDIEQESAIKLDFEREPI